MPRGVPRKGTEDWFRISPQRRKALVKKWLDQAIGGRNSRATFFVRKEIYTKARRLLRLHKLPGPVKRDINRLIEEVD